MKAYNRKHKPKHWSTPRWSAKDSKSIKSKTCILITRGIKNKYSSISYFKWQNNSPEIKTLTWSERRYKRGEINMWKCKECGESYLQERPHSKRLCCFR